MNLNNIFLKSIEGNREFADAVEIISSLTSGRFWLIGGFVYRSIAHSLYSVEKPKVDLDFIVDTNELDLVLPPQWKQTKNHYNNPKLVRDDGLMIDIVLLKNVHSINRRGLVPSIENFLTGTPLNIQSIAYDVLERNVIGDIGLDALWNQSVGVNNYDQALIYSSKKNIPLSALIIEKAKDLDFSYVLPSVSN